MNRKFWLVIPIAFALSSGSFARTYDNPELPWVNATGLIKKLSKIQPCDAPCLETALAPYRSESPVPGMIVIGNAEPHELSSIQRFAKVLFPRYGLTLVLVSEVNGLSVPGVDGLVLDANEKVVANFSLKTMMEDPEGNCGLWSSRCAVAIDKMPKVGDWQAWLSAAMSRYPKVERYWRGENHVRFKKPEAYPVFRERYQAIQKVAPLFGIGTNRPSWILLDAPDRFGVELADIARTATPKALENNPYLTLLLSDTHLSTIFEGKMIQEAANPCEGALGPQ